MSEPPPADQLCTNGQAHCLHPLWVQWAAGGTTELVTEARETVCCHCGKKATMTATAAPLFHGKYCPKDPFNGR